LPRPIIKSHAEGKSGRGRSLGSFPKFEGSPLILQQRLKLATSILASSWGLPRSIIKSYADEKVGVTLDYGAPRNLEVPYIHIYTMAEASDIKLGPQLEFAKAHHKTTPIKKSVWPWAREAPQNFGVPYNISATAEASNFKIDWRMGFAKAHHKIPHEEKVDIALG